MESQADGLKKKHSKKPLIAGGVSLILILMASAFFLGKKLSHPAATPSPHASENHEPSGRDPAHDSTHPDPAAPHDEHEDKEEEIEIEFAKHGKPKKNEHAVSPISDAHADDTAPAADHKKDSKTEKQEDHHAEKSEAQGEHADSHAAAATAAPEVKKSILERYADAWVSVQRKVEAVRVADEEAMRLRKENAYLRMMLETSKFSCRVSEQAEKAKATADRLKAQAGAKAGRTLSAIKYQIPENLLPEQLNALAVSYFKQKDDEKAVTIFTYLSELENDDLYRSAENYLMTAISWYRLENYAKSNDYLDIILKTPIGKERERHLVQAKLWKALVAKKLAQGETAQRWLKKTLEAHPHAREVRWVNPQEGDRGVASQTKEKDVSEKTTSEHEAPASPAQHSHH